MNIHPTDIQQFLEKPIGILGAGLSGTSVAKLINHLGGECVVYDESYKTTEWSEFTKRACKKHRLIINSPGFTPKHPWLKIARSCKVPVISEIEFASYFWKGSILLVTGTNGKSTISKFLTSCLNNAGLDAYIFGNIGIPFSEHYKYNLDESAVAVIELSSFQAWNLQNLRAAGLIWSNFAEDHLDWHGSMQEYFASKWKAIEAAKEGIVVAGLDVADYGSQYGFRFPNKTYIVSKPAEFLQDFALSHANMINLSMVAKFCERFNIHNDTVADTLRNFQFLSHRVEYVGESAGVTYWNDSKATNFHSVISAFKNFEKPVIWIGGGKDKSSKLHEFTEEIAPHVDTALLIGETGIQLKEHLDETGTRAFYYENLENAVLALESYQQTGMHVLFSPGFSSFDQFHGYEFRGNAFKRLIREHYLSGSNYTISQTHTNN